MFGASNRQILSRSNSVLKKSQDWLLFLFRPGNAKIRDVFVLFTEVNDSLTGKVLSSI